MIRQILVVEDDHDMAEMMTLVLESAGFSVTAAFDGRSGLAALEGLSPCVVILDLMMPDVDGLEFRARQRRHTTAGATPVLVVSGRHDAAKIAAEMEAAGFLPKPFTPDDLVAAVSRIASAPRAS